MSNLNAIGLIAAVLVSGLVAILYGSHQWRVAGMDVITGVARGVPLSLKLRWLLLLQQWVSVWIGLIVFAALIAFAEVRIAQNVADEGIQLFAYLCAVFVGTIAINCLLNGISMFVYHVNLLRQSKPD